MKTKFFSLWIGLLLAAAGYGQSGTTGSLAWSFDGETLIINGNGTIPDYNSDYYPAWE